MVYDGDMAYEALRKWADDYTAWLETMALKRKACLACEQEAYLSDPNTDLDAAMLGSRADEHKGPYCKRKKNEVNH